MDKTYQYVKRGVTTFKLDLCCWVAPLRVGICVIACLDIMYSLIALIGIADESFAPTITKVQEVLLEDSVTKPIPILAYATELSFYVLLLGAIYRKDIELLRVFMYYITSMIIASILFYSMVMPALDVLVIITIVFGIMFEIYVLILVRSAIVEIKEERRTKNGNVPAEFLFSTLAKKDKVEQENSESVEKPKQSEEEPVVVEEEKIEQEKEKQEQIIGNQEQGKGKLPTVEEHPNEIRIELNPRV